MKVLLRNVVALLTVLCALFSMSCQPNTNSTKQTIEDETGKTVLADGIGNGETYSLKKSEVYNGGVHVRNYKKTNSKIVSAGQSVYKILVPSDASPLIMQAAADIRRFIEKSSGASIEIIYDSASLSGKNFISLGNTSAAVSAGISKDGLNGSSNGYIIKTIGKNVYICSNGDAGVSNGAYDFLKIAIGWEFFTENAYIYNESEDVYLYDFDVTEIPDFEYRINNYGKQRYSSLTARRMRMNLESEVWIPIGTYYHNSFVILPPSKYISEHPDWYSEKGTQLCYSNENMLLQFVENFKHYIESHPGIENATLTQEDNNDWCQCSECAAAYNKYGTNSAVVIKFVNKVSEKIHQWMDEQGYDWNLNIVFFAYNPTVNAPVYEKNGEYYPIDDSVICGENVYVFYAPIEAVYSYDFYHEDNKKIFENMKKWMVLSKKMYLWVYSTDFYHYLSPFDTWNSMQNIYKFAASMGVHYMYDQAQMNNGNGTDFYTLKMWLNSKLQWNVNQNVSELIKEFFEGYFEDAAPYVIKYYNELRSRFDYIEEELGIKFFVYIETEKRAYWPLNTLNQWLGYLEEAKDSVKYIESENKEKYNALIGRIGLETLSLRYLKIQLYSSVAFNDVTLLEEKKAFRKEATAYGITRYKEGGLLSELWKNWGMS